MAKRAIQTNPGTHRRASRSTLDDSWEPLHPMHRNLVARLAHSGSAEDALPAPVRMATIFYLALMSWAGLAGLAWLLYRAF